MVYKIYKGPENKIWEVPRTTFTILNFPFQDHKCRHIFLFVISTAGLKYSKGDIPPNTPFYFKRTPPCHKQSDSYHCLIKPSAIKVLSS